MGSPLEPDLPTGILQGIEVLRNMGYIVEVESVVDNGVKQGINFITVKAE